MGGPECGSNIIPALTATVLHAQEPVMADHETTVIRPSFQPRVRGTAAAYLAWQLSGNVVITESGCWEWQGTNNGRGYGHIDLRHWEWPERAPQVHRVAYMLCVGPIPDGMNVLHRCDNPPCCCPDHLFLGTTLDNIADKINKGRQAKGKKVRKNHEHLKGEVVVTARMTAEKVMELRRREAAGESFKSLADAFGLSETHVGYIVRGKAWAHLPVLNAGKRNVRTCPKCGVAVVTYLGKFNKHLAECNGDLLLGKE